MPLPFLVIAGAVAFGVLASIITYFLTSSEGKARAAEYKSKITRIVEILKERLERLEKAQQQARQAREEAERRAAEAERRAAEQEANARAHQEEAKRERARAERAARAEQKLRTRLSQVENELRRWGKESNVADGLIDLNKGWSLMKLPTLSTLINSSPLLSEHKLTPSGAMEELGNALRAAEQAHQEEKDDVQRTLREIHE